MIPLVKPYMPPREVLMPALEQILHSGYISTGQAVDDFEMEFRRFIGNPNMLSLHSGTDALHLAFILAGVKPGDEVISTPMTPSLPIRPLRWSGPKSCGETSILPTVFSILPASTV